MKFNKTMKKCFAVVLSLAMVLSSVTIYSNTAKAADEDLATMVASEAYNLALGCTVTSDFTFGNEGNLTNLTNGNLDAARVYPNAKDDGGYYQIDLGKYYTVDSIDQIVSVFNETNNETWPSKNGGYYIQYSLDGSNFVEAKHFTGVTLPAEKPYAVTADVSDVTLEDLAAVRYVRLFYPDRYGYGVQVKQLAVLNVNNDAAEAEIEMCDDAAGVTVTSDSYNSLSYTIEAGEGQEDYVYNVTLDGGVEIGKGVKAGETYTIDDVTAGEHTVSVISIYNGKVSKGITSEPVAVADVTDLFASTKNVASVLNNEDSKIIEVTSYYDDAATLDRAQAAINGVSEGNNEGVAIRTAGNDQNDVVIDLGANYKASEFDRIVVGYANGNTCPSALNISFSADNATYTSVATTSDYKYSASKTADTAKFNTENYEGSVRYVKLSFKAPGWGAVINEIAVALNVEAADATIIIENKTIVEAPTIASKEYTGETLTADVEENELYKVTANEGGTDVGTYDVVLELNDIDNYYWKGDRKGTTVAKTVTFEITKAANEWTEDLAIESWKYGEEAKVPTAAAKFGDIVYTYSTEEDGEYTEAVPENAGTYYVKAEVADTANYAGLEPVVTSFEIEKADQNAPEGIETVASTLEENADGMITNVTDAMEYRAEDETEYTPIEGTEIADVFAGKYYVRYQATDNYNASAETEVVVETGRKLAVDLISGEGYEVKAVDTEETEVVYGTEYAFQVILAEGYKKDSNVVVKVNGEEVKADAEGVYKVEVTEDIEVTVEGVVKDIPETTAPVVTDPVTTPGGVTPTEPQTTPKATTPSKKTLKKTSVTVASKKKAAKKVKITFKKVKGAKKYNVQISTTKKFKKVLVKKTVKKVKVTITSKKLANKKKLYVRVKAVGAKQWSKAKKIKIK